jgi:glycosyltransferase involved in cell wall biosynthesis
MPEVLIPVGPSDRLDWVKKTLSSAVSLNLSRVIVYDNSEREDLSQLIDQFNVVHVKDKRMKQVNMARLRNKLISLARERVVVLMDSDVVIKSASNLIRKVEEEGYSFSWMHYAYSEDEMNKPTEVGENNPNLGCASLDLEAIKKVGMFDEKYARDEDVWVYSKLRKEGMKVGSIEERCLHLNRSHERKDLRTSIKEARRNLWRPKYDVMLMMDGLTQATFLTGYTYYGSYYIVGVLSVLFYPASLLYLPIVGFGIKYYGGFRRWFYNLIPGLALALAFPYGIAWNLVRRHKH